MSTFIVHGGCPISGIGTHFLQITGATRLHGADISKTPGSEPVVPILSNSAAS